MNRSLLALLLYLSQPGGLLIADEQDDQARLSALNKQAAELYHARKPREAIPVMQEALELCEKTLGPDHLDTAKALNHLGILYSLLGDYTKAEPLFQRALRITEKAVGPEHQDTAKTLSNLGRMYQSLRDYGKAKPLFERALSIDEKALGPEDPNTAVALSDLGELYYALHDYAKAAPLFERALRIDEKVLGPEDPDTAVALMDLGALYLSLSDSAKAEPLFQRALKIREKALGPEDPDTARALSDLGALYLSKDDYARAEPLFERALKIDEKTLGPDETDTANALNNLGKLYESKGDYAKAAPLFERSVKINEKVLGLAEPDAAKSLSNLGHVYLLMGDYANAEPLLQRALKIREKAFGSEDPDTAVTLSDLGLLYYYLRDYAKAEPLFQRALKITEKVRGAEHPDTAQALIPLAVLDVDLGNYAKALAYLERSVKIHEKTLGPQHADTEVLLFNSVAELCRFVGDYAKAEQFLQRALKICEETRGPDHLVTAMAVASLGKLYHSNGDYPKAEPLYKRSLKITEKAVGRDNPTVALILDYLGALKVDLGKAEDAIPFAKDARQAEEKYLSNILSFTSEQQRLAFHKTTNAYTLFATLGSAAELAQTVLRQKGVVLDSLLEDRLVAEASADPKQRGVAEQLLAAKQRLMQLVVEVPKDLSEGARKQRAAEKEKLSAEVEQLEASLARQVTGLGKARRALSVTAPQVQSVLPKQAVLVELLRYSHYLGKTKSEDRYGAIVISATGEPKWVPLGVAAEIDENAKLYQKSMRGKTDEATLRTVLQGLGERVWAPIEKALPEGCTTVIMSPDGELSFISFATLLTPDDRFLAEKYSISYVASGRDLLIENRPSDNPITVVFANPDFGSQELTQTTASSSSVALRSLEMRDLQSMSLGALPGTAKEAAALKKYVGKTVKVFLGSNATEAELRQVSSPRVLHLATHGFFLPEVELGKQTNSLLQPIGLGKEANALQQQPGEIPKRKLENPMYRSGLALAGAQRTLRAWSQGEVPPVENDGIVTAEEVGGLKLNGTWLVVLSACDTGSGEARAGEGVMGLRRGFIQAGAQNLLMTLWPINDQATVKIMLEFYEAADKTQNAPRALAEVQRDALVEIRSQHGREHPLLDSVRLAGSFIMSSRGKP